MGVFSFVSWTGLHYERVGNLHVIIVVFQTELPSEMPGKTAYSFNYKIFIASDVKVRLLFKAKLCAFAAIIGNRKCCLLSGFVHLNCTCNVKMTQWHKVSVIQRTGIMMQRNSYFFLLLLFTLVRQICNKSRKCVFFSAASCFFFNRLICIVSQKDRICLTSELTPQFNHNSQKHSDNVMLLYFIKKQVRGFSCVSSLSTCLNWLVKWVFVYMPA